MFFSFRAKVMLLVGVIVLAAGGFVAYQQFGSSSDGAAAPAVTVPTDAGDENTPTTDATTDPTADPTTATDGGTSEPPTGGTAALEVSPEDAAAVEEMINKVVKFDDVQYILEVVDVQNGVRSAVEQMAAIAAEQFSDAVLSTGPVRTGLESECGAEPCLVVDLTITVPSTLFSTIIQILAVEQGDTWVVKRDSICKVTELAGAPCL